MGMGLNKTGNYGGQVYFDPIQNQYYTEGYKGIYTPGYTQGKKLIRTYLGQSLNNNQTSNISNLVQQAMNAQANPVSMAQLFPYMNYGATDNTGGMGGLLSMAGRSGAGRFLSGNIMPQQPIAPTQPSQPVINPTVQNIQNPAIGMTLDQYRTYAQTAPRYTPQRMSAQQATAMGIPLYDGKGPMMNAFGQPMMMGGFNFADNSLQAQRDAVMAQAAAQRSGTSTT